MSESTANPELNSAAQKRPGNGARFLRWLIPLLIIAAGIATSVMLIGSGPKARMAPQPPQSRLVEVTSFTASSHTPMFEAMCTVMAAQQSTLYPMVSGTVVALSDQLMPGGQFSAGDELLRIDEADYQLSLRKQEALVAEAQAALQEELGEQAVAKREYELLGRDLEPADKALVLRQPQLASAKATLASAKAGLDQARLDLARTRVIAPFDGMVLERNVDLGTRVTTSTELLSLVNVDTFWIEASVPVGDLPRIAVPRKDGEQGAAVELYQIARNGVQKRHGRVLRLIPELDGDSRMARLLIELDDPLALKEENAGLPPLMVNDYVRVNIAGEPIPEVVKLPRSLLHDADTVWIMSPENKLEIRPVEVVHRADEYVLIKSGIDSSDRIITVELSTPVTGMPLRLQSAEVPSRPAAAGEPRGPGRGTGS